MKITQHGQYLTKMTAMWVMNCYLVQEDDGFTVVDTVMPGHADDIIAAVKARGSQIKRIALTHAHVDHIGSLDALKAALPDVEVIIGEREARLMDGDMSLLPDEPQDKPKGGFPSVSTRPTRTVKPGDMVGSLRVVAAPGHTPGQVAYLDTRDNTLIAGDAYSTQGGLAVTGKVNWLFPLPAFATWHKPTALRTAKALRELNPSRLATGHGKVLENPASTMDKAIKDAEKAFN